MTAGLIQLVSYGAQDVYMIHNPEITFFKIVYRRHTNFSTEPIQHNFNTITDFSKTSTCIVTRHADLIRKIYLVVTLPEVVNLLNNNLTFRWVNKIGYAIIKKIELEIGADVINELYGDWLNIWYELTTYNNLDSIIGNVEELTSFSKSKKCYKLFIPLEFWFNKTTGLSLPSICLDYNNIKINVEFTEINKLFQVGPTHFVFIKNSVVNFKKYEQINDNMIYVDFDNVNKKLYYNKINNSKISNCELIGQETGFSVIIDQEEEDDLSNFENLEDLEDLEDLSNLNNKIIIKEHNNINNNVANLNLQLKDCFLLVEHVFLDNEERAKFTQTKHEYLIDQVQYLGEKTLSNSQELIKLNFTQPVRELYWVISDNNDKISFEYLNKIKRATLMFNGLERLTLRDNDYFSKINTYYYHTRSPEFEISSYSFSQNPEDNSQPSGAVNFTLLDDVRLKLELNLEYNEQIKIRIYALSYNIFRVDKGLSGVLFSRDNLN
jgi:hypothetical protein